MRAHRRAESRSSERGRMVRSLDAGCCPTARRAMRRSNRSARKGGLPAHPRDSVFPAPQSWLPIVDARIARVESAAGSAARCRRVSLDRASHGPACVRPWSVGSTRPGSPGLLPLNADQIEPAHPRACRCRSRRTIGVACRSPCPAHDRQMEAASRRRGAARRCPAGIGQGTGCRCPVYLSYQVWIFDAPCCCRYC